MKRLSKEKVAQILRLREDGFAYPQIIVATGASKCSVQKFCSLYRPELRTIAYKRTPQHIVDEITKLRRKGLSLRKIEKEIGVSSCAIQKICKKYCPGLSQVGFRKVDPKVYEIIKRHYKDGYTTKELSKMAGCHIATVQRYLKSIGVQLPLTITRPRVLDSVIYDLYKKGFGTKDIAIRSGYHRSSVKRSLKKQGVKLPLKRQKKG